MYDNKKIGIGIVTYNRRNSYKRLFDKVNINADVDYIITVKNKDIDYEYDDPSKICDNKRSFAFNVKEDLGVGYCKNICLTELMKLSCDHLFLIEDDIDIVDPTVFREFIKAAESYNLGHMNWNTLPMVDNNPTYTIHNQENIDIDISFRVCGCFSYFSKDAIRYCGLINDKDFINALEHAEHAYRMSLFKYAPPFYAFPGIHEGHKYLKECSETHTTIDRESDLYRIRLMNAANAFVEIYGKPMNQIQPPSLEQVKEYFLKRMALKYEQ